MKTTIATIIAVFVSLTAMPSSAEAGPRLYPHKDVGKSHTFRSGTSACGCPIYTKRVVAGVDRHRHPVYYNYPVAVNHRCNQYRYQDQYRYDDRDRSYNRHRTHRSGSHYTVRGSHGWITIRR